MRNESGNDLAAAWRLRARLAWVRMAPADPDFACRDFVPPPWDGSPLAGAAVLLHAEQGLGDTLQFIRYALLVKERGGFVIVECPTDLLPLACNVSGHRRTDPVRHRCYRLFERTSL